ncbi:ABC transporter substrate-binding protein, partial [Luoshenia tenuis]|uniref:ABC transporter substrate-binding protein n=1 Tax=Luoshenia tenuis TaxID=2763654 RepID=UPI003D89C497
RCDQLTDALKAAQQDLSARTQDIADADKPTAYSGAVTFSGGHGFEGTYANFPPFTAIGAKNVVDETGLDGSLQIDLEKVLVWDPEVIFLDPGNMDLVNEQYDKNPTYFQSLQAVQNGEVYSMISYNNYTTNVELAVADAYYAGTVMFPEQFADIDIEKKTDELFELFLGKPLYSDMQAAGLSFGKITIGE